MSLDPDELVADSVRRRPSMYVGGTDLGGYVTLIHGLVRELLRTGTRDLRWSRDGDADVLTFDGPPPDFGRVCGLRNGDWAYAGPGDDPTLDLCVADALSEDLRIVRDADRNAIRLRVRKTILTETGVTAEAVRSYFRRLAHLNPGVRFTADHGGPPRDYASHGMIDLVRDVAAPLQLLDEPLAGDFVRDDAAIDFAFAFHSGSDDFVHSFAAHGRTPDGGTHEDGLLRAIADVRRELGVLEALGVVAALHVRSAPDLRFAGCLRSRVDTPRLFEAVRGGVRELVGRQLGRRPELRDSLAAARPFYLR